MGKKKTGGASSGGYLAVKIPNDILPKRSGETQSAIDEVLAAFYEAYPNQRRTLAIDKGCQQVYVALNRAFIDSGQSDHFLKRVRAHIPSTIRDHSRQRGAKKPFSISKDLPSLLDQIAESLKPPRIDVQINLGGEEGS